MKKGLILLPLAAFMLSSCMLMPGKKTDSSSGGGGGGGSQSSDTGGEGGGGGGGGGGGDVESVDFDFTSGTHTAVLNFVTDYSNYKDDWPFVDISTGIFDSSMAGMAFTANGSFPDAYSGSGYLMMRNKDKNNNSWSDANGNAFIATATSLGAITSISFTCGANASSSQSYVVSLSKTPIDTPQASGVKTVAHPGTQSTPITATVADGYSYFAITTKDGGRNGQIATLSVTYTI